VISIITPLHHKGNPYILKGWQSLASQTNPDFEWIVLVNNGGDASSLPVDERIKIFYFDGEGRIGLLKREACLYATGSVILELDADDSLEETALARIADTFSDKETKFAYSDCIEFKDDGSSNLYGSYYGWKYSTKNIGGKEFPYNLSFEILPATLRQIFWAPNHLRAWDREAYIKVGGHDPSLAVGDDHDLICRFYIAYGEKGFRYIPDVLYYYSMRSDNTFIEKGKEIADQSMRNYHKYKERMILRWCEDNNLLALDLGGAHNPRPHFVSVDKYEPAKLVMDLESNWGSIPDNSVGVIRAADFVEHIHNPIEFMNRAYKALVPGGWMLISVPSTDGRGAFQDPTHVSFWNENSFWYYTDPNYSKYIPDFTGKFQISYLETMFPSDWHRTNNISYVISDLIAVKPGYQPAGECKWRS